MEIFGSTKQTIQTFISHSFESIMQKYPVSHFLFSGVFLNGLSGSLHLVLLLLTFVSWGFQKLKKGNNGGPTVNGFIINRKSLYNHKQILVTCLSVSSLNLVLCSFTYFCWTEESSLTLLDFSIKTVSWGLLLVYVSNNSLCFVRFWWVFYLSVSLYCLVIDFVLFNNKHGSLPIESLLSNLVSAIAGMFFVYVAIFGTNKSEKKTILEEPLLDCDASNSYRGDEIVTPYSNAGLLSLVMFSWIGPLVAVGYKKTLNIEDIPQLDVGDSVVTNFAILRNKIKSECESIDRVTTFKLAKAVFLSVWKEILLMAMLLVLSTLTSYVGPYFINAFFKYFNGQGKSKDSEGYILVFAFIAAKLVDCLSMLQWFFKTRQTGMKVRSSLVALIFDKSLSLSSRSKTGKTSGEIVNLMTVDAERLADFTFFIHDPWIVLLQVALALLILYKNIGAAAVSTLVTMLLVVLSNLPFGKLQQRFQKKLMASKDTRMRATSELLRNMRILKLQAWEMKFLSKIAVMRKTEAGWLRKFLYSSAISTFVFKVAPTIVSLVTFGTCFLLKIPLDVGKIFSLLATFKILQRSINKLPDTVSMIAQTKVSFDRISAFLRRDELPSDNIISVPRGSSDKAVEILNGNFSWCESHENPTLKDVNIEVSSGMRVAICGTVGSGKSSLLSLILGEIPKISGTVKLCGTKAYVAQSPWIQSGKIEENILFGKEMDREKYDKVLKACSLKKDLEILPFGDQSIIGERGINLSGGQKQRIQIARALYQDADIYLFDDPFSAVDAHTGSHLFKECLMGLLGSKTVIYVTHQVEFLPNADLILVIKEGRISQSGKYNEILKPGTDFIELVSAHREACSSINTIGIGCSNGVIKNIEEKKDSEIEEKSEPKGQLVKDEEREKGRVGFSVYWKYITTVYGGALVPAILIAEILFQILQIRSSYWMAWASPVSEDSEHQVKSTTLILVYVALSIGSALCVLLRTTLLVIVGYKTATILFTKMHECIFRAPMSFFDSTPSGRILNRASGDQSKVDLVIFFQIGTFSFCVIQLLGIIAVMSQVAWQVFIVFVPVISACIWYQRYYLPSARELTRLVGICKAPVIQHFAETISGVVTIRSFDQEPRFRNTNLKLSDEYSRPKFHVAAAMQWLCFRLDMLSVLTFAFSLLFLISVPEGLINPGIAGLVITYGLNLNMLQANVIWTLSNLENKIISVERIFQYTNIPSEPPLSIGSKKPDRSWPSHGEVEICDLKVRYAPHLPIVLRGISCTFRGGMKSGIVGRTGSGKSTLIQTLFRIVDPVAGKIAIDGIDISSIGLHDLRSRLSIIPQDPTMFEGTVRSNLDPLEEYTDDQIWEALDKCQLGDEVRKKEGKLDSSVSENGENWSMGQRQLVCLGRVLLKKSKVLVLDEATASVDTATDNLIQQTLRQHFSDCTVITIAHRITSVLDSDMVLLLSQGLIEEYDSPARLLENKSSSFAQLVAEYTVGSTSNF